jgi:hypothetical protein
VKVYSFSFPCVGANRGYNKCSEVDKIEFYTDQLSLLCAEVAQLQERYFSLTDDHVEGVHETPIFLTDTIGTFHNYDRRSSHGSSTGLPNSIVSGDDVPIDVHTPLVISDLFRQQNLASGAQKVRSAAYDAGLAAQNALESVVKDAKETISHHLKSSATGFVTFKTRRAQVSAAQVPILSQRYPAVTASAAPAPSDIIWENITATPKQTENVAYLTSIFYYTGIYLCRSF